MTLFDGIMLPPPPGRGPTTGQTPWGPDDPLWMHRQWLFDTYDTQQVTCPCCDRKAKTDPHRFNGHMAWALCWIFNHTVRIGEEWVDIPKSNDPRILRSKQYPTTRHSGLVQRKPLEPAESGQRLPDKKFSGIWQLTSHGIEFVNDRLAVQIYALLYNRQALDFRGELMTCSQLLSTKGFCYSEVFKPWTPSP